MTLLWQTLYHIDSIHWLSMYVLNYPQSCLTLLLFHLDFNLDYYTEVLDLKFILDELQDDPVTKKFKKLNKALVSVIEDYSLVSFSPLNVQVLTKQLIYS